MCHHVRRLLITVLFLGLLGNVVIVQAIAPIVLNNEYQVAAYVHGVQTVAIPLSLVSSLIKPEISNVLWSN